jgi:preprotein translocase subunit SecA
MQGITKLVKAIFGSANDRIVKGYMKTVEQINSMEPDFEKLSDEELRAKTDEYRERLKAGETVDDLLPEAFATVREAAKRTLGQRHFDVQLVGGMVLHNGDIAEMRTGEGKTLVATLAAYLNALPETGVHVVTVNDYLAERDAIWMGQVYGFLGLATGIIINSKTDDERKAAYMADITYGTNNEFGFDYLRDNMKFTLEEMCQREFGFAIVDEVDSILIDEARTPLIISGPTEDKSELYHSVNNVVAKLGEDDYEKEEKNKSITLTENGQENIEKLLSEAGLLKGDNLYDIENTAIVHHVNNALRAIHMFEAEKDYIVKDAKVMLIDEFTGRMMEGRRLSDGLHQAIEAKENADIQPENQTMASITFQNYFRMYPKLSGMTGTALTEAQEFNEIYGLTVVDMPTNVDVQRTDDHDEFYRTASEKNNALIEDIKDCQKRGQPILVGTVSIEKSEELSEFLKQHKIKHNVLNARYHEQEATIIGQAGQSGAVTIATNMAGRGTDIQLGGNLDMRTAQETADITDESKKAKAIEKIKAEIAEDKKKVIDAGGLYVLATERHESRRIDNQLRGRSGRQGDPGRSKFYLSLQDDLMRIFGPERMDGMLVKLGLEEGEAIIHPWINKAIEKAQQKVEAHNYDIRKNLLKYDNVMNEQRKVIYEQRLDVMGSDDISEILEGNREEVIENTVIEHVPPKSFPDDWDLPGLSVEINRIFNVDLPIEEWGKESGVEENVLIERIIEHVHKMMKGKAESYGEVWAMVEKNLFLRVLDEQWIEHLSTLDHLRRVISLRAYAQRDPLKEYQTEAFTMFDALLTKIRVESSIVLSHIELNVEAPPPIQMQQREMNPMHINPETGENEMEAPKGPIMAGMMPENNFDIQDPETWGKIPRNTPCPCGSGKKYKHCHGSF